MWTELYHSSRDMTDCNAGLAEHSHRTRLEDLCSQSDNLKMTTDLKVN